MKNIVLSTELQRTVHSCRDETLLAVFSVPFPQQKVQTCFFPKSMMHHTRDPSKVTMNRVVYHGVTSSFLVLVFCWYQICWIFGISVVSFPPFLYTSPLSSPLFSKKGWSSSKGGHCPPFEEKEGHCPLLDTEMYRPSFPSVWYWYTGEIPTEYRPKIPNWYHLVWATAKTIATSYIFYFEN